MKEFIKVYDFRKDKKWIEFLRVWVFGNQFGESRNQPIDGYIPGTIEWFAKIDEGQLPLYKVQGVISKVHMTGHNDWPEFEIDSNGVITEWTRMGNETEYIVGREVIVTYTKQELIDGHVDFYETVLEIEILNG
jgi:hypothetical protein